MPYGLALIEYTDPDEKRYSFKGVGIFVDGILTNAPFSCLTGDGVGLSFSMMQNGRPADNTYYTFFNESGYIQNINLLNKQIDVSGQ